MQEIWEPLKCTVEHGDNYEVSTYGRVRNTITKKNLKLSKSKRGYVSVALYLHQKPKRYFVHTLVALAFIPNPENKPQVNHIKGKEKDNNWIGNLEWATQSENMKHAYSTGLEKVRRGTKIKTSKLTEKNVVDIKKLLMQGHTQQSIADRFNISRGNIKNIQLGTHWSHVEVDGFKPFKRSKNSLTKLSDKDVIKIRELYRTGEYTMQRLADQFGVSNPLISDIIHYKRWRNIS